MLRRIIEGKPERGHGTITEGCSDMRPSSQAARVFATSPIREGQPASILEAMSAALPVVATAIGGIPAQVNHNLTGLLSPCSDAITLANNMSSLLGDPAQCARMGEAGRARVESDFAFSAMVTTHEKLFERLWELRRKG